MEYQEIYAAHESVQHPGVRMNYLVSLPREHRSGEKLPLILFLHGGGEKGSDPMLIHLFGAPKMAWKGEIDFPCVLLSPQVPEGYNWVQLVEETHDILLKVMTEYPVDKARVSLTGMSMGGFGAWALGIAHPETFSALAPICGGGEPEKAIALSHLPVLVYHGERDHIVPLEKSQSMVDAVNACGGHAKLKVLPVGHDESWRYAYEDTPLLAWLSSHRKA